MSNVAKDQLHGWKEIATYLGRDERTAKRWEKQRGLPVRRIPGNGRANVYVLLPELAAWLSADAASPPLASSLPLASPPLADASPSDKKLSLVPVALVLETPQSTASNAYSAPSTHTTGVRKRLQVAAYAVVFAGVLGIAVLITRKFTVNDPALPASSLAALAHPPYRSVKADVDQEYLQSVYFFEQRTPESLGEARRTLLEVTAHDPQHAPAFAELANTYLMLREFASVPDDEAYRNAQDAASRAIALDPNLPEAHASLGYIDFFSARNPTSAQDHFDRAIRLDPTCALAHHWYGSLLTHQGRYPEALDQLNRAQQLQPASSAIQASRAYALGLSGQRDEAVRLLRSMLKTDPNAPAPHRILARLSLMPPRNLGQYLDETQRFAELRQDIAQQHLAQFARAGLQRGGEREMWKSILAYEQRTSATLAKSSYVMAEAEAQLGQTEQSLQHLEQLRESHDSLLMNLVIDPLFEPLSRNPEFRGITASVGLRPNSDEDGARQSPNAHQAALP